jgi:hypothetical protein
VQRLRIVIDFYGGLADSSQRGEIKDERPDVGGRDFVPYGILGEFQSAYSSK